MHSQHGIGVYGGIVPLTNKGITRDYIMINYLGNDKVYVPVEKIGTIYKYSDADGVAPKINKLNSTTWAKTKMKVRSRIKDISDEWGSRHSQSRCQQCFDYDLTAQRVPLHSGPATEPDQPHVYCNNTGVTDLDLVTVWTPLVLFFF